MVRTRSTLVADVHAFCVDPGSTRASRTGERRLPTDEQLMAAYARGDDSAFRELFRRYGGLVLGYMRRGYRPDHDARDLTQQTFLQLHRARRDFRGDREFRPWLMTIARNVLRDHLRRERRSKVSLGLDMLLDRTSARGDEIGAVALRDALDRSVAELPRSLRVVVEAYWQRHLTHAEIAREMGISHGAVRVRAHRAYGALRKMLREEGFDVG